MSAYFHLVNLTSGRTQLDGFRALFVSSGVAFHGTLVCDVASASFVAALCCTQLVVPLHVGLCPCALCVQSVVPLCVAYHPHVPSKNVGTVSCVVSRVC